MLALETRFFSNYIERNVLILCNMSITFELIKKDFKKTL